MSALDPRPAAATGAQGKGSIAISRRRDDVTECGRAKLYGLATDERGTWRRSTARVTLWLLAAAISLIANAELFMLLAHRPFVATDAGPRGPDVLLVDLPAVESTPATPARTTAASELKSKVASAAEPETKFEAREDDARPETASREPEPPADEPAPSEPSGAAPAEVPAVQAPEAWSSAPLPVPRPHSRRQFDAARPARVRPAARPAKVSVAARPARADAPRREARMVSASAYAGAASTADWRSQVIAALNRAKHYPDGSEAAGSPTVRMMVAASGDVGRVAIVATSGSSVLDSAAVDTVRRTSPLPPPPGGATGLTFRMNFHLRSP